MKDSYRIGRILKRLTGIRFLKSKQTALPSKIGLEKAKAYLTDHKPPKNLQQHPLQSAELPAGKKEEYLRYQQEIEALKLLNTEQKPQPPGRILKLPTGRKELMSKSED